MAKTKLYYAVALAVNLVLLVIWYHHQAVRKLQLYVDSDYQRLINITFQFKHIPDTCTTNAAKFFIAVHTAPDHFDQRKTIRETWGSWKGKIPVLFFVGMAQEAEVKKKLQKEIAEHEDFVQGNFLDSYRNIAYKHQMIFKYALYHCSQVEYVVKVNDYAFVNVPNLADFIEEYSYKYKESQNILCKTVSDAFVARSGKYAISEQDYPSEDYPTHCAGYFIIYPKPTALKIYLAVQNIEYFWIDDVLMTGIIPKALHVRHTNIDKLILDDAIKNKIVKNPKFAEEVLPFLFAKQVNANDANAIWKYIMKVTPKSKILEYLKIYA